MGITGREHSSSYDVSSFGVVDLAPQMSVYSHLTQMGIAAHITEANVLNKGRIEVTSLVNLLQQAVDYVVEPGVLEAALLAFGQWCAQRKSDDNIVGVLLCAVTSAG